jgi:hypothetical protein
MSEVDQVVKVEGETSVSQVPVVETGIDEKRIGNKESGVNLDALASDSVKEVPEVCAFPSFFIDEKDRQRIELDILCDKKTGKIESISRANIGIDFTQFKYFSHTVEWFEFSVPTYEDMASYRQRSSIYRREAGKMLVDANQLRNFFIVWHLKDWSLRDSRGNKVELSFTDEGALDNATIKVVYKTPPTLLDVLMTTFEKEVVLT